MKRWFALGLTVASLAGACRGGGGITSSSVPTSSETTTVSAPGPLIARTNGCHKTRDGETELLIRFALEGPEVIPLREGEKLGFRGTVTSPATWTTTGSAPRVDVHPGSYINHILIPEGEPLPATMSFHLDVFLARSVPVRASSLSGLEGAEGEGPLGPFTIETVETTGAQTRVRVALGPTPLPPTFSPIGPGSATLGSGGRLHRGVVGPGEPPVSAVDITFDGVKVHGPVTLALSDWTVSAEPQIVYTGAVSACANV